VKARMGRPPLAEGKAREIVFTLRLSPEERDAIVAAAARMGNPVTQWARGALLAAAAHPDQRRGDQDY
jgi:predicted HicB family RNase H-like nuclease